jgi:hypothetical protein
MLKPMAAVFAVSAGFVGSTPTIVSAYSINGKYASLVSCDYGWSAVRGESGYTGTYEVLGEYWTVYFGTAYCKY